MVKKGTLTSACTDLQHLPQVSHPSGDFVHGSGFVMPKYSVVGIEKRVLTLPAAAEPPAKTDLKFMDTSSKAGHGCFPTGGEGVPGIT